MNFSSVYIRLLSNLFLVLKIGIGYKYLGLLKYFLSDEKYQKKIKKLHLKYAESFLKNALRFGGGLIKVGQAISTRVDIMPVEFTELLSTLQDQVPPVPFEEIKKRIIKDLEKSPEEIFAFFEEIPIASASLGQAHKAILKSGEKVAVKVQYPNIDRIIEADLKALRFALWMFKIHVPKSLNLDVIYEEFSRFLNEELDYIHEAQNAEKIKANFTSLEKIFIPRVYWEYTTKKVLTLEFVEGEKITDFARTHLSREEKKKIANILSEAYCKQFFVDKFFHGDPHPANIFIQKDQKVAFVDFGVCKDIDLEFSEKLKRFAKGLIEYDSVLLTQAIKDLGIITSSKDFKNLHNLIEEMISLFKKMSPREFKAARVLEICSKKFHRFAHETTSLQIPADLILISRTVSILEGLSFELDPSVNIVEVAKPYLKKFIKEEKEILESLIEESKIFGKLVFTLPRKINEFLNKVNAGEIEVLIKETDLEKSAKKMLGLIKLLLSFVFVIIFSGLWFVFKFTGYNYESTITLVILGIFLILLWHSSK